MSRPVATAASPPGRSASASLQRGLELSAGSWVVSVHLFEGTIGVDDGVQHNQDCVKLLYDASAAYSFVLCLEGLACRRRTGATEYKLSEC